MDAQGNWWVEEPIDGPGEDVLARLPFARRVASVLEAVASAPSSTVVGIVGPWGSGKTSTLRLIENELPRLDRSQKPRSGSGRVTRWSISWLNPWLLSGPDAIVVELLACIRDSLPPGSAGKNARKAMKKYAGYLVPMVGMLDGVPVLGHVGRAVEKRFSDREKERTLEKAFEALAKELDKLDDRILVVIDDVDRLQPEELLALLKSVRALGRLPHVHYLLAYDQATLIDVLTQTPLAHGRASRALAYLEKIVTVRLDQPPTRSQPIDEMLRSGLDHALSSAGATLTIDQANRLATVRERFLVRQLAEPRRVRRFLAQLHTYLPLVDVTEVDLVDFVVLTHFRLAYPRLYDELSRDRLLLCDTSAELPARWTDQIGEVVGPDVAERDAEEIVAALSLVFPSVLSPGPVATMMDSESRRRDLRASSPEYVDRYFDLNIQVERWTNVALRTALLAWAGVKYNDRVPTRPMRSSSSPEELRRLVLSADIEDETERAQVLRRLAARTSELTPPEAASALGVLLWDTPGEVASPLNSAPSRTLLVQLYANLVQRGGTSSGPNLLRAINPETQEGRARLVLMIEAIRISDALRDRRDEDDKSARRGLVDRVLELTRFAVESALNQDDASSVEDYGTLIRWIQDVQGTAALGRLVRNVLERNGASLDVIASHFVELGREPDTGEVVVTDFHASAFVDLVGAAQVEREIPYLVNRSQHGPAPSNEPSWANRRAIARRDLMAWLNDPNTRRPVVRELLPLPSPTITPLRNHLIAQSGANQADLQVAVGVLLGDEPPVAPATLAWPVRSLEDRILQVVAHSGVTEWARRVAAEWQMTVDGTWSIVESNSTTYWLLKLNITSETRVVADQQNPIEVVTRVSLGVAAKKEPALELGVAIRFAIRDLDANRKLASQVLPQGPLPSALTVGELIDVLQSLLSCRDTADELWSTVVGPTVPELSQTQVAGTAPDGMARVVDIGEPSFAGGTRRPTHEITFTSSRNPNSYGPPRDPDDLDAAADVVRAWAAGESRRIEDLVDQQVRLRRPAD